MRNYVLVIVFTLFSTLSFAQNKPSAVDISKLTPEQQSVVQTIANQMAEKKSDAPAILEAIQNIDSTKVKGWAEAGTEAGKAVGNFAKELAVPVQMFLNSYIGQATYLLVFMNYGGGKLTQFMFDALVFVALTPLFSFFMWKVFKRFVLQVVTTTERRYNANTFYRFIGFNEVTTKTEKVAYDSNDSFWSSIIGWVFIVGCSLLFFHNMWPHW